jgi:hypothetical protein
MVHVVVRCLVVALAGCAGTFGGDARRPQWHDHANRVGEVLTLATMACDFGSTEQAALDRWSGGRQEGGVPAAAVMGATPSPATVAAYFAVSTALLIAVARMAPKNWRPLVYATVVAVELHVIYGNTKTTRGVCGLSGSRVI